MLETLGQQTKRTTHRHTHTDRHRVGRDSDDCNAANLNRELARPGARWQHSCGESNRFTSHCKVQSHCGRVLAERGHRRSNPSGIGMLPPQLAASIRDGPVRRHRRMMMMVIVIVYCSLFSIY